MSDDPSALVSQSVDSVSVGFSSDSVISLSEVNSVSSASESDLVSVPVVGAKRSRGRDRTRKANQRKRAAAKAAKEKASRAIVRLSELQAEVRTAQTSAQESLGVAKREQRHRLATTTQLDQVKTRLRESESGRRTAEGRAREFAAQLEIQKTITDNTVLSAVRGKLLDLQKSAQP